MPIATPEVYAYMIDRAKAGKFAYPAINVTSSSSPWIANSAGDGAPSSTC